MGNLYYKGATATCLALCKLCDEFHIARSNCISRKNFLFLSHKGLLNALCSGLDQTGASGMQSPEQRRPCSCGGDVSAGWGHTHGLQSLGQCQ